MQQHDVVIVGAGASGLMCAIHAARKGLDVLVLESARKPGIKILVSGGGRCNFTNTGADPRKHYLSNNPHFCISAMRRYSPSMFIDMVEQHQIAYHEKSPGQLFCDDSARQIVAMLLRECDAAGARITLNQTVTKIQAVADNGFTVQSATHAWRARKVVIASGGLSMPKVATDLAYRVARQLRVNVVEPTPALVPFTWNTQDKARYATLSGVSVNATVACGRTQFDEAILFTHRGLSGPGVLQISSFWQSPQAVIVNLLPAEQISEVLSNARQARPKQQVASVLKTHLPNRVVDVLHHTLALDTPLATVTKQQLAEFDKQIHTWQIVPAGTEGYKTAEVTLGGINTDALSSKTFEFNAAPGIYAIGEALDVTGWLGGYNFQWAWASGYACAQAL